MDYESIWIFMLYLVLKSTFSILLFYLVVNGADKEIRVSSGYNHSGRQGTINFLNGVMGIANAQRTLNIIRTVTEFISQPEYKNVVPMFSVLNEPYAATIGVDMLRHLYVAIFLTAHVAPVLIASFGNLQLHRNLRNDAFDWRNRCKQRTFPRFPRWIRQHGSNCRTRWMGRILEWLGSSRYGQSSLLVFQ